MSGSQRQRRWVRWLLFAIAVLSGSAYYSALAPVGAWPNQISGEPAWCECDPGSFYVASAHELAWGEPPLFVGHPGATLTPLLRGVQSALHLASGGTTSFTHFTARHLPDVFFVSKLMMSVLHLLSFWALYAVSMQLLRDERAATIAVLGYASSLPVLYFLSRISVEPLMVLFFALSFLAIWRYQDLTLQRRLAPALGCAALGAAAAVSGAMTKLAFLGPLPFFLGLYLLVGRVRGGDPGRIDLRTRGLAFATFAVAGGVTLALYSQIIDWKGFASAWRMIAPDPFSRAWEPHAFLPGLGSSRIFLLAELSFCCLAAAGWGLFMRRGEARERGLWFSGYGLYGLLFWGYRVAIEGSFLPFHYFFIAQATLAVFFGDVSVRMAKRIGLPLSGAPALAALLAWVALIHGIGAFSVNDSRRNDVEMYEARRPAFEQLAALGADDRIGVLRLPDREARSRRRQQLEFSRTLEGKLSSLHGMLFPMLWDPRASVLASEFARLFVPLEPGSPLVAAPPAFVPALELNLVVLRSSGRDER